MTKKTGMTKRGKANQKPMTKSVLDELYELPELVTKVNNALDTGERYADIIELCGAYGVEISAPTLSRYKGKREEAIQTGTPIEELLDMRKKNGNIIDLQTKRNEGGFTLTGDADAQTKLYSHLELLDKIIEKSFIGVNNAEYLDANTGMNAIMNYAKVTGNAMQGLSLRGVRELQMRNAAKMDAVISAVFKYIPQEQHEEVFAYMEEAESQYFEGLDISEEDKRITEAIDKSDLL